MDKKIVVAVTGASGTVYALRLVEVLKEKGCTVYLIMSDAAVKTLKYETDTAYAKKVLSRADGIFENGDIDAPPASGSFEYDAFVVVPCSVNTIGMIHSNLAGTLIGRCAAVAQKERRQVILVPRETPFSTLTLKQLYELSLAGIEICAAAPGFYSRPQKIEDLVDFIVFKVLSLMRIESGLIPPWGSGLS